MNKNAMIYIYYYFLNNNLFFRLEKNIDIL